MRILVTGGAGFIGSHLVRALLRQGDEVIVFDRVPVPHLLSDVRDSITYVQGDAASEVDLYRAVATSRAEGIFHLGALLAGACEENPPLAFQINFRSTQVLLDAALSCGVKRFFFMSSISLYAPSAVEPVPEDAPKEPATIYGQTKLAGEHLLRWYGDTYGLDVRGIRPTWVWGPNRSNGLTTRYTSGLVGSIAAGGEVHLDNPDERGDWIYVHDTVKAMLLVWNAPHPSRRFYTVCGSVHTLREVAEIANRLCPETQVTYAKHGAVTSPYACSFDDTPIREELGYAPDWSIEDSVKDYIRAVTGKAC